MLTSIVLSCTRVNSNYKDALRAIIRQESREWECIIVVSDPTQQPPLDDHLPENVQIVLCDASQNETETLNNAFARTHGEIMTWQDADDILCPWALSVVTTIFERLPQLDWVSSTVPMQWSASRLLVSSHAVDGYARETFFLGRNLGTGSSFAHPIPRVGTFWRRRLWERSGSRVSASLQSAGDFELWTRFWNSASLASLALPLGGQSAAISLDEKAYWQAAAQILKQHAPPLRPYRRLQQFVMRYNRQLRNRWGSPATRISFAKHGKQCVLQTHRIR